MIRDEDLSRLLSGELPDAQAAAMRAAIQDDPEVAARWASMQALVAGAFWYVEKPMGGDGDPLATLVERAVHARPTRDFELRAEASPSRIVGRSRALMRVLQVVERVARTDATVLITGESGAGKELIARAIHERRPFAISLTQEV